MRGVRQQQSEIAVAQNVPHRLPIDAGRLHRDMGAALGGEPLRQRQQFLGRGLEGADLTTYRAVRHVPLAGHDRVLVHVEPGAMWVENLHAPLRSMRRWRGIPSTEL